MDPNTKISSSKLYSGKISIRLDKYYLGNKIIEKEIVTFRFVGIVAGHNKKNDTSRAISNSCRK